MHSLGTSRKFRRLHPTLLRTSLSLITLSLLISACRLLPLSQPEAVAPPPTLPEANPPTSNEITPPLPPDETSAASGLSAERVPEFPDPAGFSWQLFAEGFDKPVYLTHAGDGSGRLFVVEKPGQIWILQGGQRLPTPFLDIRSIVSGQESERGLLSLVFHPDYLDNGYFFIFYSNLDGDSVTARYQVSDDPNTADPESAEILIQVAQPYTNHNGGHLAFGPDGYLYISTGDGGSAGDPEGNGQDRVSLLGKIFRLDINGQLPYEIPEDNPFFGLSSARGENWAYGLRNPWRYSFDRATGDLFIGDVGQSNWEEIDLLPAGTPGGNLGWDLFEGDHRYEGIDSQREGMIFPILEYPHTGGNCSVTGGYVYRGQELPELYGVYLFGDYCTGIIWGALPNQEGLWRAQQLYDLPVALVSFGEDEAGELYLVDLNGGVYRLVGR